MDSNFVLATASTEKMYGRGLLKGLPLNAYVSIKDFSLLLYEREEGVKEAWRPEGENEYALRVQCSIPALRRLQPISSVLSQADSAGSVESSSLARLARDSGLFPSRAQAVGVA